MCVLFGYFCGIGPRMGSHWHDPPWAAGDRDGLEMAGPRQSPMAPSGVPVSKPVGYAAAPCPRCGRKHWQGGRCTPPPCLRRGHEGPAISNSARSIIDHNIRLRPHLVYTIENPPTSLCKDQDAVHGLPSQDVDYCCFGFPYRKSTRLWTNLGISLPRCS